MTYLAPHPRGSRLAAGTLAVLLFSVNCGRVERGPSSLAGAESIVRSALPVEWQVAEVESGQIPWGHHWGEDYQGPTGQRMVLVGPRTVNVSWCAQDGTWNRSPMAREALVIWIMPGNYRDSWGSILSMHAPIPPKTVLNGRNVRVYGQPSHQLNSREQFDKLMESVAEIGWPESPANGVQLSWPSWKTDLHARLAAADLPPRDD